jgi:hypothetical protein
MASHSENPTERALSFARLPDRIDGWRVLAIGGKDFGSDYLTGIGAAEIVVLDQPVKKAGMEAGSFDFAICGVDLETDAHPLAIYAWLRRVIKADGVLVAGSRVLADPTKSQYARFVPTRAEDASDWIPGRLAFRWMVEVSGFGVTGWLGEEGASTAAGDFAFLQARAAERPPALDLDRQPLPTDSP